MCYSVAGMHNMPAHLWTYFSNYSPPSRPPPTITDITIDLEQLCIGGKVSHSTSLSVSLSLSPLPLSLPYSPPPPLLLSLPPLTSLYLMTRYPQSVECTFNAHACPIFIPLWCDRHMLYSYSCTCDQRYA